MSLFFTDCEVSINGSGILAESAQLETTNPQTTIPLMGYIGNLTKTSNGEFQTSCNLNYILSVSNQSIYNLVSYLKTGYNNFNFNSNVISLGGVTGNFYLSSYNLNLLPNSLIKVSANFIGFTEFSGNFQNAPINYNVSDTILNTSVSLFFKKNGESVNVNCYNLNYSFQCNWQPEYIIGSKFPIQVQLGQVSENLKFQADEYKKNVFSGMSISDYFVNSFDTLEINALSGNFTLSVPLDNFTVKSTEINGQVDSLVFQTINLIK